MSQEPLDYESRTDPSKSSSRRTADEKMNIGCIAALVLGLSVVLLALLRAACDAHLGSKQ